jgi:hypothetical protein
MVVEYNNVDGRDDEAYRHWLEANPRGFVLNATRNQGGHLMLHRAHCHHIKDAVQGPNSNHYTHGTVKVCSTERMDIAHWTTERTRSGVSAPAIEYCKTCDAGEPSSVVNKKTLEGIERVELWFAQQNEFDPENEKDARDRVIAEIVRRRGQAPFRRKLLKAYGYRCAITEYETVDALEAAHIRPYFGPSTNVISNGLLLRSDIHTLLDLGLISIDDEFRVMVSARVTDAEYRMFCGREIRLPNQRESWPSKAALAWHRKEVFAQA